MLKIRNSMIFDNPSNTEADVDTSEVSTDMFDFKLTRLNSNHFSDLYLNIQMVNQNWSRRVL